jgi:hypothetical protein
VEVNNLRKQMGILPITLKYCFIIMNIDIDQLNDKINWEFVKENPDFGWDWKNLSSNPSIDWEFVKNNVRLPWNPKLLTLNPAIDWEFVKNNKNNPDLDWIWIKRHFSDNTAIDWKFVKNNPDFGWDWKNLSLNPAINWNFVKNNKNLPWDWEKLSLNPSIDWIFVKNNKDLPWVWGNLSNDKNIDLNFVKENNNLGWDWGKLSRNVNVNDNYVDELKDMDWDSVDLFYNKNIVYKEKNLFYKIESLRPGFTLGYDLSKLKGEDGNDEIERLDRLLAPLSAWNQYEMFNSGIDIASVMKSVDSKFSVIDINSGYEQIDKFYNIIDILLTEYNGEDGEYATRIRASVEEYLSLRSLKDKEIFGKSTEITKKCRDKNINESLTSLEKERITNICYQLGITCKEKDIENCDYTIPDAQPNNQENCTICLENLENGKLTTPFDCIHNFHEDCLPEERQKILQKCPLCQKSLKFGTRRRSIKKSKRKSKRKSKKKSKRKSKRKSKIKSKKKSKIKRRSIKKKHI